MKKKKTKSSIPRKHRMEEPVWRAEAPKKTSSKLYYFDKRYYFNLKAHRWKRHIDGTWDNGPLIYKVPLYPEQAVLSCCMTSETGYVRFDTIAHSTVCERCGGAGGITCHGEKLGKDNCQWYERSVKSASNQRLREHTLFFNG